MRAIVLGALVASVGASAGCSFSAPGIPTDDAPRADAGRDADPPDARVAVWLDGFQRRRLVTPVVGALAVDDVTVLVVLRADAELATVAPLAAAAVAFAGPDGVRLPSEVERITPAGDLVAWVRLPHLGTGTAFYLYYDHPAPPAVDDAALAWSATTYDAVWHFTDVTAATALASTAGHIPMVTAGGRTTPDRMDALRGQGREMTMQTTMAVGNGTVADHAQDAFTFSVLINSAAPNGEYDMPIYKGGSSANDHGYDMELGNGAWRACVSGVTPGAVNAVCTTISEVAPPDGYHYLVAVADLPHATLTAYLDGAPQPVQTLPAQFGTISSMKPLTIGRADNPFHGMIDELRVYKRPLSREEIAFEAKNLLAPEAAMPVADLVELRP